MLSAEKVPEGFVQAHDTPLGRLAYVINDLQANISSSDSSLSPAARSLIDEATRIVNGLDPYLTCMTSPHPPILDKMIKAGNETDWKQLHKQGKTIYELIPEMTAGSYEAVVLQQLAKTAKASAVVSQRCYTHTDLLRKAKNILEIGMFTGTTTVALALLPSVTKVVTLELEGFLADFSIPYFAEAGVAEKIEVKIGDARESLDKLAASAGIQRSSLTPIKPAILLTSARCLTIIFSQRRELLWSIIRHTRVHLGRPTRPITLAPQYTNSQERSHSRSRHAPVA